MVNGSGKTTLMDCIAGRKTVGHITGNITVNGHPKDQRTWARVMGCVSVYVHLLLYELLHDRYPCCVPA